MAGGRTVRYSIFSDLVVGCVCGKYVGPRPAHVSIQSRSTLIYWKSLCRRHLAQGQSNSKPILQGESSLHLTKFLSKSEIPVSLEWKESTLCKWESAPLTALSLEGRFENSMNNIASCRFPPSPASFLSPLTQCVSGF